MGNLIYVMAGVASDQVADKEAPKANYTEIYDPATNEWFPGPELCSKRQNPAAANFLDTLYVVGGYCSDQLDSVERLPIEASEVEIPAEDDKTHRRGSTSAAWQWSTPLPEKRDACRVVVLM